MFNRFQLCVFSALCGGKYTFPDMCDTNRPESADAHGGDDAAFVSRHFIVFSKTGGHLTKTTRRSAPLTADGLQCDSGGRRRAARSVYGPPGGTKHIKLKYKAAEMTANVLHV